jgi:restriction endonuclease S subunit
MSFPRYEKYKDSGVAPLKWFSKCASGDGIKSDHIELNNEGEKSIPVIGGNGVMGYANQSNVVHPVLAVGRVGALCGNVHFVKSPAWITDNALVVNASPTTFNIQYLAEVLRSRSLNDIASKTAQPLITGTQVSDQKIPCPTLSEQSAIATFLDLETAKIDELIAEQQKLIDLLKEKRQAVISHAVTKGLNPDVPMKDSGVEWLGEVPEHWDVKRLKFLCKVQTGDKDTVNAIETGRYPFFVRSQTVEHIDSYTFDCEGVLTAGDGVGVGKVFHYVNGKFDFHQRVYMMNNFQFVTGTFFFWYLSAMFYKVALEGGAKSTVDSLRMPLFMNFAFAVPPEYEQEEIIDFLDRETSKIYNLIDEAQTAITLLQERRTALISAAVTGKIDVRGLTAEQPKVEAVV